MSCGKLRSMPSRKQSATPRGIVAFVARACARRSRRCSGADCARACRFWYICDVEAGTCSRIQQVMGRGVRRSLALEATVSFVVFTHVLRSVRSGQKCAPTRCVRCGYTLSRASLAAWQPRAHCCWISFPAGVPVRLLMRCACIVGFAVLSLALVSSDVLGSPAEAVGNFSSHCQTFALGFALVAKNVHDCDA